MTMYRTSFVLYVCCKPRYDINRCFVLPALVPGGFSPHFFRERRSRASVAESLEKRFGVYNIHSLNIFETLNTLQLLVSIFQEEDMAEAYAGI